MYQCICVCVCVCVCLCVRVCMSCENNLCVLSLGHLCFLLNAFAMAVWWWQHDAGRWTVLLQICCCILSDTRFIGRGDLTENTSLLIPLFGIEKEKVAGQRAGRMCRGRWGMQMLHFQHVHELCMSRQGNRSKILYGWWRLTLSA